MSSHSIRLAHLPRRPVAPTLAESIWATIAAMVHARSTRKLLREMDDRLLADIGIGRGDAWTEASRPMWDLRTRR